MTEMKDINPNEETSVAWREGGRDGGSEGGWICETLIPKRGGQRSLRGREEGRERKK